MNLEWAEQRIAWLEHELNREIELRYKETQSYDSEMCIDSSEDDDGEPVPFGWVPGKCAHVHNRGNAGMEYMLQETP